MTAESVEQFITFLQDVAYQTHENSSRLAALERTLAQHQDVNTQYKESFGRLRFVPAARADRQKTEEILEALRQVLLASQPPSQTSPAAQGMPVRPRPHRRPTKKKQPKPGPVQHGGSLSMEIGQAPDRLI